MECRARHRVRRGPARRATERARDPRRRSARGARPATRRSRPARGRDGELRRPAARPADVRRGGGRRRGRALSRRVRAGLALNERGYDRLLATGLDEVRFAFGVTESFNQRNQGAARRGVVATARRIAARARSDGVRCTVTLSVAFGCPFEGEVDPGRVVESRRTWPRSSLTRSCWRTRSASRARRGEGARRPASRPRRPGGGHFHNTRNTGYANALAALEAGASVLDASVGGLGGCPFAPRATGNIATEDLVYLLDREGVETGIDLGPPDRRSPPGWRRSWGGRSRARSTARARSPPSATSGARREDRPAHLAELELARAAAQDDLVAVLEEGPRRAVREPIGLLAVPGELDQRSLAAAARARRSCPRRRGRRCGSTRRSTVAWASCCGIVQ